jgi:hypothetical protein
MTDHDRERFKTALPREAREELSGPGKRSRGTSRLALRLRDIAHKVGSSASGQVQEPVRF